MDAFSSYFTMGGYGSFVWPAYVVALLVMAGVLLASLRAARAREAELDGLQRLRPGRRARRAAADISPESQTP